MKYTANNTANTIRFRRWSRTGYAVFCSLSCTVTIGKLSVSVSDKTLQKSTNEPSNALYANALKSNSDSFESDILEFDIELEQTNEASLIKTAFDNAAAGSQTKYYNINCNG
jgi:hypothetical protein